MRRAPTASSGISTRHAPALDLPFRFLTLAVLVMVGLAFYYPWYLSALVGSFYSAERIAFVHINTLGWLAPILIGASYQLVPVVMQTYLYSVRLGRITWWIHWPSAACFLVGWLIPWSPAIALGGGGLLATLSLYSVNVLLTVRRSERRDFITWHVVVATILLLLASLAGLSMALNRWHPLLGGASLPLLSLHVTFMLGGWVTLMIHGVAYRLVGMFTLAEDLVNAPLAWAELAATASGALILGFSWPLQLGPSTTTVAVLLLAVGAAAFALQLIRMYAGRRRRTFDVHIPFAAAATLWELLAIALLALAVLSGQLLDSPLWKAVVWLATFGWAGTMEQGMLYKIATFLTWLHRYAPLAGRQPVPKLEQLYSLPMAMASFGLWTFGVASSAAGLLVGISWVLTVGGCSMALAALAFGGNMAMIARHWFTARVGETQRA